MRQLFTGQVLIAALLVGGVFGLPHLLIPLLLGSGESYTPFTVSADALSFDESYIYAAQANYTRVRWARPFDTDLYEYRNVPSDFPTIPYFAIAGVAALTGGTERAFIICDFVLPPIAFLLLFALLMELTADKGIAVVGALATIMLAFGPRNWMQVVRDIASLRWPSASQPLEYSRLLHPQLSFTLFILAVLLLWIAVRKGGSLITLAAGLAGGALFYVYFYYWPVWLAATALLAMLGFRRGFRQYRRLWAALAIALVSGSYFWISHWKAVSFPNYLWRAARFAIERGHIPPAEKLALTVASAAAFGVMVALYAYVARRSASEPLAPDWRRTTVFLTALFLAACAALNMEIVTGMNVESMDHFPNRVFQPLLILSAAAFIGPLVRRIAEQRTNRIGLRWQWCCLAAAAALISVATLRQAAVAANSAEAFRYPPANRVVFTWLNKHTAVDDVVMLPVSDLAWLLPAYTHSRQWIPNGTRTTASNEEILWRFLVEAKIHARSEEWIRQALGQSCIPGDCPVIGTYVYYLFQGNFDSPNRALREAAIEKAILLYRAIRLEEALRRFRLNYIYTPAAESMVAVPGWKFTPVLNAPGGTLHRVSRLSDSEGPATAQGNRSRNGAARESLQSGGF